MLLTRVVTALVLLPLVVGGMLLLPVWGIALVLAGVFLIGAWEWGLLTRLSSTPLRLLFVGLAAGVMLVLWFYPGLPVTAVLVASLLWWILAVHYLLQFPRGWDFSVGLPLVSGLLGLILLAAPYAGLTRLHATASGPQLMLCMFVLIWAADTGAYFAGRALGRHKLAPAVSPGKTREGAIGGVLLSLVAAGLGAWWFGFSGAAAFLFVMLGGVTALFSIVGDLCISMFKRQAGVKDAGRIFPGHGGVLDRLDSTLAAAPCFVLGMAWLPIQA